MTDMALLARWLAYGLGIIFTVYVVAKIIGYGLAKGILEALKRSNKNGN
jgi:hypothetical protein